MEKSDTLLVSLMTFWKENGGSLLGHGISSLRSEGGGQTERKKDKRTFGLHPTVYMLHLPKCVHRIYSLLLGRSHVSLGLDHFVHKLPEADGEVV